VPLWLSYPLVGRYCGYALMRGEIDGIYPYPFLDVAAEGMISVSFNGGIVLGLLAAFWIGGLDAGDRGGGAAPAGLKTGVASGPAAR
jgi:hypothetical protein